MVGDTAPDHAGVITIRADSDNEIVTSGSDDVVTDVAAAADMICLNTDGDGADAFTHIQVSVEHQQPVYQYHSRSMF